MIEKYNNWCELPTPMGPFRMYDLCDEHLRLISFGDIGLSSANPLVRVQSSCIASEVFGARDCDCADQLREAMKLIANEGQGLIFHLHHEGRGHGLSRKIQAVHAMQYDGLDTVEAFESLKLIQDIRSYESVVEVLHELGIVRLRMITNNPAKVAFFRDRDFVVALVNTHPTIRPENEEYLRTKKEKLNHDISLETEAGIFDDIRFYHSDQPWGEFSNYSRHAVFLREKTWPTVEHLYQAQKFVGTDYEERIRTALTPTLAKQKAKEWKPQRRSDWDVVKEDVMLEGLRAKFNQHPDLKRKLLSTRERRLVEFTDNDAYWGENHKGLGKNRLGELLMQLRSELMDSDN